MSVVGLEHLPWQGHPAPAHSSVRTAVRPVAVRGHTAAGGVEPTGVRLCVLYGGCGLLFAVEIVRILVCWKPATVYAATVSTAESVMISRYADLSAVAWPLETVRWIALAAVVAAWLVWGMQAYRHAKKN